MKRLLFVLASASAHTLRDGIEAALAALAFEHRVSILLEGDAMRWLAAGQQAHLHGLPDMARGLAGLLHHGAEGFVIAGAAESALSICDPARDLRILEPAILITWIAEHDHVFRF